MNPMIEAWSLLKGNPAYQANMQGTSQRGAGGSLPQQFMQNPGAQAPQGNDPQRFQMQNMNMSMPQDPNLAGDYKGQPKRRSVRAASNFERGQHPSVGQERSFQTLEHTGQQESDISRQPKQGFLQRRRDNKQQQLAQRAEETGEGKDYRAAYPIDASQGSVFEER